MITQDLTPIYLKLADRICDGILSGKYETQGRIPSVRELATLNEVNPNTAMRAFDWLQQKEIIFNKRGMGYFVSPKAKEIITEVRKEDFCNNTLPFVFKTMLSLDIDIEEISLKFEEYKTKKSKIK